jgi:hypothetical protein
MRARWICQLCKVRRVQTPVAFTDSLRTAFFFFLASLVPSSARRSKRIPEREVPRGCSGGLQFRDPLRSELPPASRYRFRFSRNFESILSLSTNSRTVSKLINTHGNVVAELPHGYGTKLWLLGRSAAKLVDGR